MGCPLVHRFQAALLGATLGHVLENDCRSTPLLAYPGSFQGLAFLKKKLAFWHPRQLAPESLSDSWLSIAMQGVEALSYQGDWRLNPGNNAPIVETIADLAVATLPLMVFFHDQPRPLQQRLQQWVRTYHLSQTTAAELWVIARTMTWAMQPRTPVEQFLAALLANCADQSGSDLTHLRSYLERLIGWLTQKNSLTQVTKECFNNPEQRDLGAIALALYCVLSTPDHFSLSLLRSAQSGFPVRSLGPLVGALAGAATGLAGIPLHWRMLGTGQTPVNSLSGAEVIQSATQLFVTWSGTYQPRQTIAALPAVAAPGIG